MQLESLLTNPFLWMGLGLIIVVIIAISIMISRRRAKELEELDKMFPEIQAEEKDNRGKGCLKAIAKLFGLIVIIILGLLILNALTGIGDELQKQTGIMDQQTDILRSIERGILDLLEQIQHLIETVHR
jgi:hypothetical protein